MEVALGSSQIHQNIRRHSETLPFAFRSTDWDDQIFDVHKKTTMIEVPGGCVPPRLDPWATQLAATRCLQHRWLPNSARKSLGAPLN